LPLEVGGFVVEDELGEGIGVPPDGPDVVGVAAGVADRVGDDGEVVCGCGDMSGAGTVAVGVPEVVVGV
jgi:hypothetical protein